MLLRSMPRPDTFPACVSRPRSCALRQARKGTASGQSYGPRVAVVRPAPTAGRDAYDTGCGGSRGDPSPAFCVYSGKEGTSVLIRATHVAARSNLAKAQGGDLPRQRVRRMCVRRRSEPPKRVGRRLAKLSMNVLVGGRSHWGRSRAPFLWSKRKRASHEHRFSIAPSGRLQSPAPSLVQQRHVVGALHAPLWWPQAADPTVARHKGDRRGGSAAG